MTLANPSAFFTKLRSGLLGPTLEQSEIDGVNAILTAMEGASAAWTAYALATAYLETAHTMQPIKEMGGPAYFFRMYDPQGSRPQVASALGNTHPGDGVKFAGRGFVQLTGRRNYTRACTELGVDLLTAPDRVMEPAIAAQIMRRGMSEGWFTGKSFASFLPAEGAAVPAAFVSSRRIINGQDRAADVADYAVQFQTALQLGGWS